MTVCVITQPRFFPGLHYLHRMMVADIFVIFDSVQFNPRHEENRARLKGPQGAQWLTVPVRQWSREQRIVETYVDDAQPWRRKAVHTLRHLYAPSPHFKPCEAEIGAILESPHQALSDLARASWEPALRRLGITCRFVRASELAVSGKGPELLLAICQLLGADVYLSGAFGRTYLDPEQFTRQGVQVAFHEYTYPQYPQRFGDFLPWMSYLDMLFNADLDSAAVRAGGSVVSAAASLTGAR